MLHYQHYSILLTIHYSLFPPPISFIKLIISSKELSNADSVASVEDEVRSILYRELAKYSDEVFSDRLGSIVFHKKGTSPNPLKIMFCAHIDEVGFMEDIFLILVLYI